jgi:hypothetical protein
MHCSCGQDNTIRARKRTVSGILFWTDDGLFLLKNNKLSVQLGSCFRFSPRLPPLAAQDYVALGVKF